MCCLFAAAGLGRLVLTVTVRYAGLCRKSYLLLFRGRRRVRRYHHRQKGGHSCGVP